MDCFATLAMTQVWTELGNALFLEMVCAKFAHTTFVSNYFYLEQLSGQFEFFLRRELRVELHECFGVAFCDKVFFGVAV